MESKELSNFAQLEPKELSNFALLEPKELSNFAQLKPKELSRFRRAAVRSQHKAVLVSTGLTGVYVIFPSNTEIS